MDRIIVTFKDKNNTFSRDLELPANTSLYKLRGNIIAGLNKLINPVCSVPENALFIDAKTGRKLSEDSSLAENGIMNGDYILISGE